MKSHWKKWVMFTLRWGIAAIGIWYVLRNVSLHDTVMVQSALTGRPAAAQITGPADPAALNFTIVDPDTLTIRTVARTDLLVRPGADADKATLITPQNTNEIVELLALKVTDDPNRDHWPIIVAPPRSFAQKLFGTSPAEKPITINSAQLLTPIKVKVEYPVIDDGIVTIIREARGWYLLAAVLVFPITFSIVAYRWGLLLHLLGISISSSRTFVLTMVGLFYNNFMPGSTGGDLIKAYYASKNTPKRTAVVLSVLIDRIIGLLALIVLGGTMAALQWDVEQCRKIAIACGAILGLTAGGLVVFYVPILRKATGLDLVLRRLPMQRQVQNAIHTMELYGKHPWTILWALIITLPVHATVIISAWLAGKAFGLPLSAGYYWVVVPVIVLSGAIPISPQGAGVMEFFAILLTRRQGATVTHAFLLTMSIRLVQMLWNLSGAIFVFRGGYAAPDDPVQADMDAMNDPLATG